MTTRQINLSLWAASGVLFAATIVIAASEALVPLRTDASPPAPAIAAAGRSPTGEVASGQHPSQPPLEAFNGIWGRRLRQPLIDAEPQPETSVADAPPSVRLPIPFITLVGTIGTSVALLRTSDGAIRAEGIGDQLAGTEILAIRPAQVDLRYAGKQYTIEKTADNSETPVIGIRRD